MWQIFIAYFFSLLSYLLYPGDRNYGQHIFFDSLYYQQPRKAKEQFICIYRKHLSLQTHYKLLVISSFPNLNFHLHIQIMYPLMYGVATYLSFTHLSTFFSAQISSFHTLPANSTLFLLQLHILIITFKLPLHYMKIFSLSCFSQCLGRVLGLYFHQQIILNLKV